MRDSECVDFLQWALPRLHRRWPGFRKVRGTTCKRIDRHLRALNLSDIGAYRRFLEHNPPEWSVLEALLPITISSFYRDKAVFDFLGRVVFTELAGQAAARGAGRLQAWSIGCASGEEPYTLVLLWRLGVPPLMSSQSLQLHILATDVDPTVLARAHSACYAAASLKRLPSAWLRKAFTAEVDRYCLRPEYRDGVEFTQQNICTSFPEETFELILCRNLVFTYFDEPLQRDILDRLVARLRPGGAFVIGRHEVLPPAVAGLTAWSKTLGVYRKLLPQDVRSPGIANNV